MYACNACFVYVCVCMYVSVLYLLSVNSSNALMFAFECIRHINKNWYCIAGLDIRVLAAVARVASRFENSLAPQKSYWPPKKLNLCDEKTICVNLQFE